MNDVVFELFCCLQCEYCNGQYDDTERVPTFQESGPERIGGHWQRRWAWYHAVSGGHRTLCRAAVARSKWQAKQQSDAALTATIAGLTAA